MCLIDFDDEKVSAHCCCISYMLNSEFWLQVHPEFEQCVLTNWFKVSKIVCIY